METFCLVCGKGTAYPFTGKVSCDLFTDVPITLCAKCALDISTGKFRRKYRALRARAMKHAKKLAYFRKGTY